MEKRMELVMVSVVRFCAFMILLIHHSTSVSFKDIGYRVSMKITSPKAHQVIYARNIIVSVEIEVLREVDEPIDFSANFLCFTQEKIDQDFNLDNLDSPILLLRTEAHDLCLKSNEVDIVGFFAGTHDVTAYVKTRVGDQFYLICCTNVMVETIDDSALIAAQIDYTINNHATIRSPSFNTKDFITVNKGVGGENIKLSKVIGQQHPISVKSRHFSQSTPVNIVIYMKELQRHGANNRLLHWLFDHSRFRQHNYRLTVVTSTDRSLHDEALYTQLEIANVSIVPFECLSLSAAKEFKQTEQETQSIQELSAFLYSHRTDVLIMLNTYGDPQSNLLLYAVSAPLVTGSDGSTADSTAAQHTVAIDASGEILRSGSSSNNSTAKKPFVFIDLANIVLSDSWLENDLHDGLLAPSRYAGMHPKTAKQDKTVAMIYPPAVSLHWLQHSPCLQLYQSSAKVTEKQQKGGVNRDTGEPTELDLSMYHNDLYLHDLHSVGGNENNDDSRGNTSEQSITSATPAVSWPRRSLSENGTEQFVFAYIGRLAADKHPGLLLHVIAYILSAQHNDTVASDLGVASPQEIAAFEAKAHFRFYGSGHLSKGMKKLAKQLGVQHMATFEGHKSEDELIHIMKYTADVLVNPIVAGETFGFVHTEAAAMGLPVVAFRQGANAETVATGLLVEYEPGRAVENFAYAVFLQFNMPFSSLQDNCEMARERLTQWSIHRHSDSLMDAVRTVLEK